MSDSGYTLIADELLEHGTYVSNTSGRSMLPLLRHHKDVVVLSVPDREIRKYDVVLYRAAKGKYILHRVIGRKDDTLVIRGDNTYFKEYVPASDVLAILTAFNRGGKKHSCDERGYILYSRIWCAIYPIRLCAYTVRRILAKAYRALFKRRKH